MPAPALATRARARPGRCTRRRRRSPAARRASTSLQRRPCAIRRAPRTAPRAGATVVAPTREASSVARAATRDESTGPPRADAPVAADEAPPHLERAPHARADRSPTGERSGPPHAPAQRAIARKSTTSETPSEVSAASSPRDPEPPPEAPAITGPRMAGRGGVGPSPPAAVPETSGAAVSRSTRPTKARTRPDDGPPEGGRPDAEVRVTTARRVSQPTVDRKPAGEEPTSRQRATESDDPNLAAQPESTAPRSALMTLRPAPSVGTEPAATLARSGAAPGNPAPDGAKPSTAVARRGGGTPTGADITQPPTAGEHRDAAPLALHAERTGEPPAIARTSSPVEPAAGWPRSPERARLSSLPGIQRARRAQHSPLRGHAQPSLRPSSTGPPRRHGSTANRRRPSRWRPLRAVTPGRRPHPTRRPPAYGARPAARSPGCAL